MSQIYCSNCGQAINGNSNFCKFCGAPQHGPQAMFKWNDPVVEKPQAVTHIPRQSQHETVDYVAKRHLGGDAVWYFLFAHLGRSFLLFALLVIGTALLPWPMVIGLAAYIAGLFIVTFLVYNNFTFEVDKHGLKIEQGIIHRHHVSVPYEQVQNVNIERTLTDRLLGLSRVSIETAGQASAPKSNSLTKSRSEAYLPGLHLKDAEKIHDLLIDGADGVHGN
jgi:membrane protein YdbS with pleckstrin-like domain